MKRRKRKKRRKASDRSLLRTATCFARCYLR
jgi:hypothetical protein